MAIIAIDIDNTLYSFDTACREAFFEMAIERDDKEFLKGAYAPQVEWRSIGDVLGFQALSEAIEKVHSRTVQQVPYKGSVETVQKIVEAGHDIKYVTTRDEKHKDDTDWWLAKNNFPTAEILCSDEDKMRMISDCQYIIEDRPKTLINFIYDYEWQRDHNTSPEYAEKRKRLAFGLWFPYNQALTDIRNILLAPTWLGIEYYLRRKGIL